MASQDGLKLLKLARDTVSLYFEGKDAADDSLQKKFNKNQGCFVTIKKKDELRGCIGFPEPIMPLYKAVKQAAVAAAFSDPRFPELERDELNEVKFELSILTVPELIKVSSAEEYLKKIKIGKDGLIIRNHRSGLLLPQVFTEYNCNAESALEMTCQKAGLSTNSWKNLNYRIYKFQAKIFSE